MAAGHDDRIGLQLLGSKPVKVMIRDNAIGCIFLFQPVHNRLSVISPAAGQRNDHCSLVV